MGTLLRATEKIYVQDRDGVRRLIAAAGDEYDPNKVPVVGVTTRHDPPEAALLPIDGYDTLTEQQVLDLLPDLDVEQLIAVHAYERTHLARGSITGYRNPTQIVDTANLDNVGEPGEPDTRAQDYGAMNVEDLQALVDERELEVTGTGKDGNVVKADLVKALQDSDSGA